MAIYIALSWTEELILVAVKTILEIDNKDLPIQSPTASVINFKPSCCFTPQREAEIMSPSFFGGREALEEGGKNRFYCRKVCRAIWMVMVELN